MLQVCNVRLNSTPAYPDVPGQRDDTGKIVVSGTYASSLHRAEGSGWEACEEETSFVRQSSDATGVSASMTSMNALTEKIAFPTPGSP